MRRWTEKETEYVKKWYCKKPTAEIAKHLDRTEVAVRHIADKLGITDKANCIRGQQWEDKEIRYLKAYYNKKTIGEIARTLRRTPASVQGKIQRLGIADSEKQIQGTPWTEKEIHYLEKNYEKKSSRDIACKLRRSINSVRRKAQSLNLNTFASEDIHVKTMAACFDCDSRVINRWIDHGLPCRAIKKGKTTFKLISVDKFWKWAENHKDLIPWQKYERLSLLPEPKWLDETIKSYEFKNNRKPITTSEINRVVRLKNQGKTHKEIAEELERTPEAIKHIWRGWKSRQCKQLAKS